MQLFITDVSSTPGVKTRLAGQRIHLSKNRVIGQREGSGRKPPPYLYPENRRFRLYVYDTNGFDSNVQRILGNQILNLPSLLSLNGIELL